MKTPIVFKCPRCGHSIDASPGLHEDYVSLRCKCGEYIEDVPLYGMSIGNRILQRARLELLQNRETALSVVFSAMAFDCELSHLNRRWQELKAIREMQLLDPEELDQLIRKHSRIEKHILFVAELIHPDGLDGFFGERPDIPEMIQASFPSFEGEKFARGITKNLFWPRNNILHAGRTVVSEEEGRRIFSIANLGLYVLQELDSWGTLQPWPKSITTD